MGIMGILEICSFVVFGIFVIYFLWLIKHGETPDPKIRYKQLIKFAYITYLSILFEIIKFIVSVVNQNKEITIITIITILIGSLSNLIYGIKEKDYIISIWYHILYNVLILVTSIISIVLFI